VVFRGRMGVGFQGRRVTLTPGAIPCRKTTDAPTRGQSNIRHGDARSLTLGDTEDECIPENSFDLRG